MSEFQRLVISCGGTGGHFFPGLSIARTFKQQGGSVLLLLSGENSESQSEIAASFGIDAVTLPKLPNWKRHPLRFLAGTIKGMGKAYREMKHFAPQAILGMGAFTMTPVLTAGLRLRIPIALHDGNARIGRSNRIFSFVAKFLGAGFPPVNSGACHCRIVDAGMPVRPELLEARNITRSEAVKKLNELYECNLKEDVTTILIFGGSLGAAVFNTVLPQALLKCSDQTFQVLHLCGKGKKADAEAIYRDAGFPVLLLESSSRMEYFLGAADTVFCRAGGSTLAELALFGKGAVLIPYPYAAEGHQQDNAEYFERNNAAVVVRNSDFTVDKAYELLVSELFSDPAKKDERNSAAAKLMQPEAAQVMIREISAIIK